MNEACPIAIHRSASGYFIRIVGRGTMRESPAVRDFVCGVLDSGADVVLDLADCEYLDSTFLGCLLIMQQRSQRQKGSFAVIADDTARQRLLHNCRLDRVLDFIEESPDYAEDTLTLGVAELERQDLCRHLLETHQNLAELGGPAAQTFQSIVEQLRKELDDASR